MWDKYASTTFEFSKNQPVAAETKYKKACRHYRDYLLRHSLAINTPRDDDIAKELVQSRDCSTYIERSVDLKHEVFETHPEH